MGTDLKLDDNYDLAFVDGDLVLVHDEEEVAQNANIRLLAIKGEWYYDYNLGTPWWEDLFTMETSYEQKSKILRNRIKNTPDVNKITSFVFGVDPVEHLATVEFVANTTFGQITVGIGV